MTKKRTKKTAGQMTIPLSSGYSVVISRPSIHVIGAVEQKAIELYPYPEMPVREETTVTGEVLQFATVSIEHLESIEGMEPEPQQEALEALTDDEKMMLGKMRQANVDRKSHYLEFVLKQCVQVEGVYDDLDKQAELVASFDDEIKSLEEWGSWTDDLQKLKEEEPFQFILRTFIIETADDYGYVAAASYWAMSLSDLEPEDIRERMRSFQN